MCFCLCIKTANSETENLVCVSYHATYSLYSVSDVACPMCSLSSQYCATVVVSRLKVDSKCSNMVCAGLSR